MSSIRENPSSIEQINHLIRSRRSVFPDQFEKDSTIPEDIIWQLLKNANWAPNHTQTEPRRLVGFTVKGGKSIPPVHPPPSNTTPATNSSQDNTTNHLRTPLPRSHILP